MAKSTNNEKNIGKLHVRKGDRVMVIAGQDKGKTGEILKVFPDKYRAIVERVNMITKHQKPTQTNPGGIVEKEAPVHISNLMLLDPKSGEPTRIGRKLVDGKLVRYSKKSGELFI
ncbi:MAG: ribosomal protein [Bacteroidota bacterium]|jgi:large subunit ribosomal protein L24